MAELGRLAMDGVMSPEQPGPTKKDQSGNSSMVSRLAYGFFCVAALMALPSVAHHSYAAYDLTQTITHAHLLRF
jgi:hypothetical protein